MKFWSILSGVVASIVLTSGAELKTEILKKVDSCSRAAAKGDMLTMHYRGSVLDGEEFDSRWVKHPSFSQHFVYIFFNVSSFKVILVASHLNSN